MIGDNMVMVNAAKVAMDEKTVRVCRSKKGLPDICVSRGSTIHVAKNTHSVNSLMGESVTMRLYAEHLEVWHSRNV